ncbi:UNVERIFIED_CONTAM: hypothetical protein PYX00_003154 [Menopon gallinae]|uniref:Uncharacterized protein n=1 Tax=Menopon gallinae TaxID=328185 RepID=A0AAW2HZR2_9NEOP
MSDFSALFRSTEELAGSVEGTVEGTIPNWIDGTLVKLGPGLFDIGNDFAVNHWFDGFAVLINFRINNGKVEFSKKFLQSDAYKKAMANGKPVFTEFGTKAYTDSNQTFFSRLKNALLPELTDSDAINIFRLEDSIFAATETNYMRRIDPYSLETREKIDMSKIAGVSWASSHYSCDETGTTWSVATSLGSTGLQYHLLKIPKASDGKAETALKNSVKVASITPSWKSGVCHFHSFGMSKNYVIFVEQPMIMSSIKLLSMTVKPKSLRECMDWSPKDLNRFYIIEKSTGKVCVKKVVSKTPYFTLHCINCYEEDGFIVFDTMAHDSPEIVDKLYLEKLRKSQFDGKDPACARRFVLPQPHTMDKLPSNKNVVTLDTTATATKIEDTWILTSENITSVNGYELPSINHKFAGKPYRYFYASGMYDPGPCRNLLLKVDVTDKKVLTWKMDEYTFPGEALFIPRPDATEEDDGVLLSTVTDVRNDHKDFLLVLDAKTMTEIGRASIDAHLPNLIHNLFIPHNLKIKT